MRRGQGNSETKQLSLQAWNVMGSWWQHKIPIWMQYTNRSEYLVRWLLSPERHSKVYHSDSLWNWNYSGQHAFKFPYSSRQKEPHESAAKFWYLWKITSSPYKILFQEKIKISMGKHRSGNTLQYKSEKKIPNCRTDTSNSPIHTWNPSRPRSESVLYTLQRAPRDRVKMQILIHCVWDEVWDSSFVAVSFQVMLLLPVFRADYGS